MAAAPFCQGARVMAPSRGDQPVPHATFNTLFEKIGGLEATMRDVKHSSNNLAAKVESLGTIVMRTAAIQEAMQDHDARINALEIEKHRREGAIGLVEWISKHWPFTLVAVLLGAIIVWANGKLHL
jgi:hypothetical protein